MRKVTFIVFGIFLACFVHATKAMDEDRAKVEGIVLLELIKNKHAAPLVVVDMRAAEIEQIQAATPMLRNRLMSRRQFKTRYGTWKNAPPGSLDISISIAEISPLQAVILAGSPMIGTSGSRDRFTLKKLMGRWVIVKRDSNYETAKARFAKSAMLETT
jgi:hypothetical protein